MLCIEAAWYAKGPIAQVKPDPNAKEAVTDMKSLSGGERSFTNMCFLLALGKQISSPFHCLDEFDVSAASFQKV